MPKREELNRSIRESTTTKRGSKGGEITSVIEVVGAGMKYERMSRRKRA